MYIYSLIVFIVRLLRAISLDVRYSLEFQLLVSSRYHEDGSSLMEPLGLLFININLLQFYFLERLPALSTARPRKIVVNKKRMQSDIKDPYLNVSCLLTSVYYPLLGHRSDLSFVRLEASNSTRANSPWYIKLSVWQTLVASSSASTEESS